MPGRPFLCGTPTEKVSKFLKNHLKPVMESDRSKIKKSGDFSNKIENVVSIPENNILLTADVVGLYPNIWHNAVLNTVNNMLEVR